MIAVGPKTGLSFSIVRKVISANSAKADTVILSSNNRFYRKYFPS